jgi:hypothetical protein
MAIATQGTVCFPVTLVGITDTRAEPINIDPERGRALAELLQVLGCGEESAVAAFDHLSRSPQQPHIRAALRQIATDELRHHALLAGLAASLPEPRSHPALRAALRRFFMRLAHRDVHTHFLRIAAIDSAVCQLLGLLRSRTGPLRRHERISTVLARIHRDEARHVTIARACVEPLLGSAKAAEDIAEVRADLNRIIQLRADSLDRLGLDPDRLRARLSCIGGASRTLRCLD